ncbi:MAG: MBL fold metallo-hydrolase [Acidimicrobiales bacterium]
MQVTATGHAGLAVRSGDAMVLVDPWFSPFGAFDASWFVVPDNLAVLDTLDVPDAVVITHEHLDHLDAWYLAQLPAEVPVVIPSYPSPILRRKVAAAGRTVIVELADRERREVAPGIGVRFVREESPMNHDAAVVLDTPDGNVVDLNDARIFPVQLREIRAELGGTIDVLALQGSGASWYPLVYDYPAERIEALCREKRATKFSYVVRAVEVAEPRVVVPFAGPPCFLDPELAWVNEQMEAGIFPDQRQVADHLAAAGHDHAVVLLPGESLRMPDGALTRLECWQGFWERTGRPIWPTTPNVGATRSRPCSTPIPTPTPTSSTPSSSTVCSSSDATYCNERIDMRVGFDVTGPGGGAWLHRLPPGARGRRAGVGRLRLRVHLRLAGCRRSWRARCRGRTSSCRCASALPATSTSTTTTCSASSFADANALPPSRPTSARSTDRPDHRGGTRRATVVGQPMVPARRHRPAGDRRGARRRRSGRRRRARVPRTPLPLRPWPGCLHNGRCPRGDPAHRAGGVTRPLRVGFVTADGATRASSRVRVLQYLPLLGALGVEARTVAWGTSAGRATRARRVPDVLRLARWADVGCCRSPSSPCPCCAPSPPQRGRSSSTSTMPWEPAGSRASGPCGGTAGTTPGGGPGVAGHRRRERLVGGASAS